MKIRSIAPAQGGSRRGSTQKCFSSDGKIFRGGTTDRTLEEGVRPSASWRMKRPSLLKNLILFAAFTFFLSISFISFAHADMPIPAAPSDGYVLDQAHILSPEEKTSLNDKIANYKKQTSVELGIIIVPEIKDDYIENFSLNVARSWGIGQKDKDNGALLAISINDRKLRMDFRVTSPMYDQDELFANALCLNLKQATIMLESSPVLRV